CRRDGEPQRIRNGEAAQRNSICRAVVEGHPQLCGTLASDNKGSADAYGKREHAADRHRGPLWPNAARRDVCRCLRWFKMEDGVESKADRKRGRLDARA